MIQACFSTVLWLFLTIVLTGCASTSVNDRNQYAGAKLSRPAHIIVYDFAASPGDIPSDSGLTGKSTGYGTPQTAEQQALGRQLGAQVTKDLVQEIQGMGLPAQEATAGVKPEVGDIVIKGYFVSVEQGNAGQRVLVGFGSGTAELKTVVEGYLMTYQGLRLLGSGQTQAEGDKKPGVLTGVASLVATGNPAGLIIGGVSKMSGEKNGSDTVQGAAQRTAKEIADELRKKFKEQGWI